MRVIESCAQCLYRKQKIHCSDPEYLSSVREIIEGRKENDSAPYLSYLFNKIYDGRFGKLPSYAAIRKKYNALVLSMEDALKKKIRESDDPLTLALLYARAGNYIDFAALQNVNEETFLSLFENIHPEAREEAVMRAFFSECAAAENFLLLADNCGEIVLDRIFLEELKKAYPRLRLSVLVRGAEVSNDALREDALDAGFSGLAEIYDNGLPLAGTVYELLPQDAKDVMDRADVILAKGQGNYETLSGSDRHIYYAFLCKCELFVNLFKVPQLTGMFVAEPSAGTGSD